MALGLARLPLLPWLHLNHSLFTARKMRLLPGCLEYNRKYPLAGLVGFLAVNFGSAIMLSVLLREDWGFLADNFQVPSAVACWYVVFFAPLDLGFLAVDLLPVQFAMAAVEGVRNALKNVDGVRHGLSAFPGSWTTAVVCGFLGGCGSSFVLWFERQSRGVHAIHDLNKPSGFVKLCLVVSLLFVVLGDAAALLPPKCALSDETGTELAIVLHVAFLLAAVLNKNVDPLALPFATLRLLLFGVTAGDDEHHHPHGRHPKPTAVDVEVKGEEPAVPKTVIAPGSATKAAASTPQGSPAPSAIALSGPSASSSGVGLAEPVEAPPARRRGRSVRE